MRRPAPLALLVALVLAGCGSNEETTPAVCLHGPAPYVRALAGGVTKLGHGTLISSCLTQNQSAGDLEKVGRAMVTAATLLSQNNLPDRSGPTAARLGFLVGAVTRGASDTGGIHANLVERITTAARFSPGGKPHSRYFEQLYRTGYAEGRAHG